MRIRSPGRLWLNGSDLAGLLRLAVDPFDPARMRAQDFAPSHDFLGTIGDLLRTYRDPDAWLRQARFRLDLAGGHCAAESVTAPAVTRLPVLPALPGVITTLALNALRSVRDLSHADLLAAS